MKIPTNVHIAFDKLMFVNHPWCSIITRIPMLLHPCAGIRPINYKEQLTTGTEGVCAFVRVGGGGGS